jgi:hypothetical protein
LRRSLAFISLALILIGLEPSSEAISLLPSRLKTGAGVIVAGAYFHVSPFRSATGIFVMAVGVAVWGALIWSARSVAGIGPVGHMCPTCASLTRRVPRKRHDRLLSAIAGEPLARRRCQAYGWVGLSIRN